MTPTKETHQVLQLLADGKITVEEAHSLLDRLPHSDPAGPQNPDIPMPRKKPMLMHIDVSEGDNNVVNVKVPLKLLKLAGIPENLPGDVSSHLSKAGISTSGLNELSDNDFYEMFADFSVDIGDENDTVRIYCK